jgi:ubiquinone biosynthesis protein
VALADLVRLPRQIQRLAEIVAVLVRHGFRRQVSTLRLHEELPFLRRWLAGRGGKRAELTQRTDAERLTAALQELGTTFVKLGQILSSRPDIVGDRFAAAFRQLRDHVEPFDSAVARQTVAEELDCPLDEVFDYFDDVPAGSGSIAQVHRATLKDGTEVMVKIQRPKIASTIYSDMSILRSVARMAEPQFPELRPSQLVDEFERAIRNELDFTVEAANTTEFHEMLEPVEGARAPAVLWELTTARVLTVERLPGVPIGDIGELVRRGHDRRQLVRTLTDCFLHQYFSTGTFHADPHAGNLLVDDDGTVGLVDFGSVGHVSEDLRSRLVTIVVAAVTDDLSLVADTAAELSHIGEDYDARRFTRDLTDLYHKYRAMPLGRMDTRRMFLDVTQVARDNDVSLPRDMVLLGKSLATLSAVARTLDPEFDVIRAVAPKAKSLLGEMLSGKRLALGAGLYALRGVEILRSLPRRLKGILRQLESGQPRLGLDRRGLHKAVNEVDRTGNRLSISIYVASLLVASSMMIDADFLAYDGISVPGVVGFGLAGILSFWLAWGILRSGRL